MNGRYKYSGGNDRARIWAYWIPTSRLRPHSYGRYRSSRRYHSTNNIIIFVVWHYGYTDLKLLKKFLEAQGHTGILPTDRNCISLLKPFHNNLTVAPRGLEAFPLRPELLFPIFFPRHELIGLNHRALEDTLQTRLLALAFDELCKPIKERQEDWRPHHLAQVTQTTITSYLERKRN